MPNAQISLCTQSVHLFSFPPRSLHTAPSRFPSTIHLGSHPPLIQMSAPAHKSLLVRNVVLMVPHRVISRARLLRVIRRSDLLRCAFKDAKQDPVVYGAEIGGVFLAKGPRTASIQEGLNCLGLYNSGLEGEHYFRLVSELP